MKTKLCLWASLSAMIATVIVGIVNAAMKNGEATIYLFAAAGFFAFLSAVFTGDLERWREANRNDRDWRIHPRL